MRDDMMQRHYEDLVKLTELLEKLVNSYRLLIGGASELNIIAKRKKSDMDDALDRVDDVGGIIDDLIDVIEAYEKSYVKYSRIKNQVVCLHNEKSKIKEEVTGAILTEIEDELKFENSSKVGRDEDEEEKAEK